MILTITDGKTQRGNSGLRGFLKLPTKAADEHLKKQAQHRVDSMLDLAKSGGIAYHARQKEFRRQQDYSTASKDELEFLKITAL